MKGSFRARKTITYGQDSAVKAVCHSYTKINFPTYGQVFESQNTQSVLPATPRSLLVLKILTV